MIELIIAGALGVVSHARSREFVQKRLRYTSWVEKPAIGVMAGVATAVVAAPLVAVLPFVGIPTALAVGLGVGTGVSLGASKARQGGFPDD